MMEGTKVTIIIPYVKDRGWLNEAIESAQRQTYKGEIEILLSQSNNRVGYNINRGIEQATGEYIKFLPEDDILTSNCIEDSVAAIQGFDFIHGNAINFYPSGRMERIFPRVHKPVLYDMLCRNHIHGGTLMYRKDAFERFGMFDESLWTGEEYELNLRMLSNGAKLGYCNSFLFQYRMHPGQKSIGNKDKAYQNKRKVEIERIKTMYT